MSLLMVCLLVMCVFLLLMISAPIAVLKNSGQVCVVLRKITHGFL
nr:MAG TPA: hypothetical protein [Caudoviricetes sp.]